MSSLFYQITSNRIMEDKKRKLQHHKNIATRLFVLMLIIYMVMVVWHKKDPELTFIGYIKAFSEAAMVGALPIGLQ